MSERQTNGILGLKHVIFDFQKLEEIYQAFV
jgi:hypothetical protein